MNKPILALDIDDVLSHSAAGILAYSNERWGYSYDLEDFNEDLPTLWQVELSEAETRWQEYMDSGEMSKYGVIPEALAALKQLREKFTIIAVTSRRDVLRDLTQEWLDTNYAGIVDRLEMAGIYGKDHGHEAHKMTKAEVLRRIGAEYLIDDQPKHCNGAAGVGVEAVLFGEYPWNRDIELQEGVTRCKDWAAVLEYFDGRA